MISARAPDVKARGSVGIAAASAAMVLFALYAHQSWPLSVVGAAGLLTAAAAIAWSQVRGASPTSVLGLDHFSPKIAALSVAGGIIGAGAGFLHRHTLDLPLQPGEAIESFVVVACLIGATEELIYRGWMIGCARTFRWPAAIVIAAVAHAAYKTALFAWPPAPAPVDLVTIAAGTFAGGLVLGMLRAISGSLIPALLAHMAFDFVVYRSLAHAPWWVWG